MQSLEDLQLFPKVYSFIKLSLINRAISIITQIGTNLTNSYRLVAHLLSLFLALAKVTKMTKNLHTLSPAQVPLALIASNLGTLPSTHPIQLVQINLSVAITILTINGTKLQQLHYDE